MGTSCSRGDGRVCRCLKAYLSCRARGEHHGRQPQPDLSGQRTDARSQCRLRSEGGEELRHLRPPPGGARAGELERRRHGDPRRPSRLSGRRLLRQAARHQPGGSRGRGSGDHRHPVGPHPAGRAGDHGGPPDEPRDPAPAARRQRGDPPASRRDDRLHGGGLRDHPLLQPDLRLPDAEARALPAGPPQRRGGCRADPRASSRTPTASS